MTEKYVSIDSALTLAVNLGGIPEGFSAKEILDALIEEAEVNYENACIDEKDALPSAILQFRKEICISRYNLYELLEEVIKNELLDLSNCPFKARLESTGETLIERVSFSIWLFQNFGIDLPSHLYTDILETNGLPSDAKWEDITITLRDIDLISFKYKDGEPIKKSFFDIGLADKRNNLPKTEAGILIALSGRIKFPNDKMDNKYAKKLIHNLRKILSAFTGIQSDPFKDKLQELGWLPRFKLNNTSQGSNLRDLKELLMANYSSAYNFVRMDDDAQKWIDENEALPENQRS